MNPSCMVCADDSQCIYALSLKDLKAFTLSDFKNMLVSDCNLSGQSLMLEFNAKIIFEYDQDEDDEDEIKLNAARLKRTFGELHIYNQSIIQVQGPLKDDASVDANIYVQIIEDKLMPEARKLNQLKKAGVKKLVPQPEEEKKQSEPTNAGKKDAEMEISSDGCRMMEDETEMTKQLNMISSPKAKKRKSQTDNLGNTPDTDIQIQDEAQKRQKVWRKFILILCNSKK